MRRENFPVIKLNDKEKKKLCDEIAAFYLEERGDEIGIIEQQQILELFLNNLAPVIYNKALDDAKNWYKIQQDKQEEDYYMMYKEMR